MYHISCLFVCCWILSLIVYLSDCEEWCSKHVSEDDFLTCYFHFLWVYTWQWDCLPNFKVYYKDIVIKTTWYWHRNRHTDQRNIIKSPERNSHIYSQLCHVKDVKTLQWRDDCLFNKWCWENWISTCKSFKLVSFYLLFFLFLKLVSYGSPVAKPNSRMD